MPIARPLLKFGRLKRTQKKIVKIPIVISEVRKSKNKTDFLVLATILQSTVA